MSWFSFGLKFSNSWKSYEKMDRLVSGQFISDYIFDTHIAPRSPYVEIKKKAADSFSHYAQEHCKSSSKDIATLILKKHLTYKVLSSVIKKITIETTTLAYDNIKAKFGFSTQTEEKNPPEKSIVTPRPLDFPNKPKPRISKLEEINTYLNENYTAEDLKEIKSLVKNYQFSDSLLLSIQLMLRPVCEKAVLKAIDFTAKTSSNYSIDFITKKTLSVVTPSLLSYMFSSAAAWTSYYMQEQINQFPYVEETSEVISYLPSTKTILTVTSLYHLTKIGCALASAYEDKAIAHKDKKRVKELAMQLVQKSLAEKIKTNPITEKYKIQLRETTVNKIAKNLIDDTIEKSWEKLVETCILGLPLVNA